MLAKKLMRALYAAAKDSNEVGGRGLGGTGMVCVCGVCVCARVGVRCVVCMRLRMFV